MNCSSKNGSNRIGYLILPSKNKVQLKCIEHLFTSTMKIILQNSQTLASSRVQFNCVKIKATIDQQL